MNPNGKDEDPALDLLTELRAIDVGRARAERLRARCHRVLEAANASSTVSRTHELQRWPRVVSLLVWTWCVVYVVLAIQQVAAVYGF